MYLSRLGFSHRLFKSNTRKEDHASSTPLPSSPTMTSSVTSINTTNNKRALITPNCISMVNQDLLQSGIAILPGCHDTKGRSLIYIFTSCSIWHERRVTSSDLAKLLMYYCHVPRKRPSDEGMTIVVDIRGATHSTINILLESLYLVQANIPSAISTVFLYADRPTHSYVIKSPVYDAKAGLRIQIVMSPEPLHESISVDQMPAVLDGLCPYNHESWIRFRQKLEPFMTTCRSVASQLVDLMEEISTHDVMPTSIQDISDLILTHQEKVKSAFENEALSGLQEEAPSLITALKMEHESLGYSEDFRYALEQAVTLHKHLQDCVGRLVRISDTRLTKLHNCLQLREYEEECTKVLDWLSTEGDTILRQHSTTADNLKAVRQQQKDFERFYFLAMTYVEKGNDLLEEANMLSQSGNFSDATSYKDLARTLKRQLQAFTGQLEESRDRIEATARCYLMLDKCYEWALGAMKYMSSMKMEMSSSPQGLDKLLRSLGAYLSDHPPITQDHFNTMAHTANRLGNNMLQEQCGLARDRCEETLNLLQLRLSSLRRARNQMEVESVLLQQNDSDVNVDKKSLSTSSIENTNIASPSPLDTLEMAKPIETMCDTMSRDYHDISRGNATNEKEVDNFRTENDSSNSNQNSPLKSEQAKLNRLPSDYLRNYANADSTNPLTPSLWMTMNTPVCDIDYVRKTVPIISQSSSNLNPIPNWAPQDSSTPHTTSQHQRPHHPDSPHHHHQDVSTHHSLPSSPTHSISQHSNSNSIPRTDYQTPQSSINNKDTTCSVFNFQTAVSSSTTQVFSSESPSCRDSIGSDSVFSSSCSSLQTPSCSTSSAIPHVPSLSASSSTNTPSTSSSVSTIKAAEPNSQPSSTSSTCFVSSPNHHSSHQWSSSPSNSDPANPSTSMQCGDGNEMTISPPFQESNSIHSAPDCNIQDSQQMQHHTPTNRPKKKVLKRADTTPIGSSMLMNSPIVEEGDINGLTLSSDDSPLPMTGTTPGTLIDPRTARCISMITGSSDSLPSLPEEEVGEAESGSTPTVENKDYTPVPVNSHLYNSTSSNSNLGSPPTSFADLSLTDAEIKSKRTVTLVMSEMIQTERDYVRALQFITDHYIPELAREDVPQMLRGKRTVIFGNLEKIHQFHSQHFLRQLEACQSQPFLVGHVFLQHETMFYLYALYNKNKPKSDILMQEYGKEFFSQKQLQLGDKMDLSSYLLKPVQRMGKYALLLKQLLKECSETDPEYPELKASEEMVKFQLRHGNDLLAMDSLRDCDVNLQEQGRLLRQEEFLVFQGRKKSMRQIFLFEDLILFSKTRRGRQGQHDIYVYKYSFKTADIGLTENVGDSGYKFEIWFRRRTLGERYILQAPSSEVKKAWIKDISKLLWRQAIRNRESRINELATMGIGNKPCLDIKPSDDNIQDRSVNVAFNNRGARARNSIAITSFDYLRNGNKRPHSIMSVSSTSSSGSSHSSSLGILGSLNLAFDHLDSPRLNRRSCTSNESGIVSDQDVSSGRDKVSETAEGGNTPTRHRGTAGMKVYMEVMRSRVMKPKVPEQPMFTDV